jgi:glycosyltransferase involved in cell wall biosynthesis
VARRGKGSALRDASKKVLEQNYDLVITLDSDLQHDPSEIPNFVLASERFDVVIGKRDTSTNRMPVHRFFSNSITSELISLRTGAKVEDSQCGYRLYRAEVLRSVDSRCRHYDYESDILIKAALAGFSVGFVPIKTIYNDSKSSIGVFDILRFMKVYLKSFVEFHGKNRTA